MRTREVNLDRFLRCEAVGISHGYRFRSLAAVCVRAAAVGWAPLATSPMPPPPENHKEAMNELPSM